MFSDPCAWESGCTRCHSPRRAAIQRCMFLVGNGSRNDHSEMYVFSWKRFSQPRGAPLATELLGSIHRTRMFSDPCAWESGCTRCPSQSSCIIGATFPDDSLPLLQSRAFTKLLYFNFFWDFCYCSWQGFHMRKRFEIRLFVAAYPKNLRQSDRAWVACIVFLMQNCYSASQA
jgi:hypothetical protein